MVLLTPLVLGLLGPARPAAAAARAVRRPRRRAAPQPDRTRGGRGRRHRRRRRRARDRRHERRRPEPGHVHAERADGRGRGARRTTSTAAGLDRRSSGVVRRELPDARTTPGSAAVDGRTATCSCGSSRTPAPGPDGSRVAASSSARPASAPWGCPPSDRRPGAQRAGRRRGASCCPPRAGAGRPGRAWSAESYDDDGAVTDARDVDAPRRRGAARPARCSRPAPCCRRRWRRTPGSP